MNWFSTFIFAYFCVGLVRCFCCCISAIDEDDLRDFVTAAAGNSQWLVVWALVRLLGAPFGLNAELEVGIRTALEKGDRLLSAINSQVGQTSFTSVLNAPDSNAADGQQNGETEDDSESEEAEAELRPLATSCEGTILSKRDWRELEDINKKGSVRFGLSFRCFSRSMSCGRVKRLRLETAGMSANMTCQQ